MAISTETLNNILKDLNLNVRVSLTNDTTVKESKKLNLEKKEEPKKGAYKVTLTSDGQFRSLEYKELINGVLFEGDTFDLIGEEFLYIDGDLFRKATIVTSWLPIMVGRTGWILVKYTDAPKEAPVTKLFAGKFRILCNDVIVRDCNDLKEIGCLNTGDGIDFTTFNESIPLKNSVLRKVIVKDCKDKALLNKTVWMPLVMLKDINGLFKIKKELPLINDLNDDHGFKLYTDDLFELQDTPIQLIGGDMYKQVRIVSSKDSNLNNRVGWINLRFTTALDTTVKVVEQEFKKDNNKSLADEEVTYQMVKANRDMLAILPNSDHTYANSIVIDKGTEFKLFDKLDSHGRKYIEIIEVGADNISRIKQYTIKL